MSGNNAGGMNISEVVPDMILWEKFVHETDDGRTSYLFCNKMIGMYMCSNVDHYPYPDRPGNLNVSDEWDINDFRWCLHPQRMTGKATTPRHATS